MLCARCRWFFTVTAKKSLSNSYSGECFLPIYTFVCAESHEFEGIVPALTKKTVCPACGARAKRRFDFEVPGKRNPEHGLQKKPGE